MKDIERIKNSFAHIEQIKEERRKSQEIRLPHWPENRRATPNSFLRSSLFSATKGLDNEDREYLNRTVLASQQGFTIRYTGKQLNQDDLTLWETLVHLAKKHPLGDICEFTAYEILKKMGSATGGNERERLHVGIIRLTAGVVEIIKEGTGIYFGSLIERGNKDEKTLRYKLQLNPDLIKLYSEATWIDWDQRQLLKRKPLMEFLHGYFSSHVKPYPVKLATLQQLSGSRIKQPAGFKRLVINALDELVIIGFLESYEIEDDLVKVTRKSWGI